MDVRGLEEGRDGRYRMSTVGSSGEEEEEEREEEGEEVVGVRNGRFRPHQFIIYDS